MGPDIAEPPTAPLGVDRNQIAEAAGFDVIAQTAEISGKAPLVIEDQQRPGLGAGRNHPLAGSHRRRHRLLAVDRLDPRLDAS